MKTYNVRCKTGQTYNLLTVEELKSLAASGLITSVDEINLDGTGKWVVASKVKGLFPSQSEGAVAPPPPAPPSPPPRVSDGAAQSSGAVQPPKPPVSDAAGVEVGSSDPEDADEEALDTPFGFGGIALSVIGAGFICLGIADFILYNFNIWDFYAAFNLYWLESFTVIIAVAVGGMLAGAGTRRVGLPAPVQWVLFSFASLFLLIIVGSSLVSGLVSGGYDHLGIVRYGSFYDCPAYTLDELANATFDDPEWESLIADDGYAYVNLSGWLSRDNLPVHALLQFRIEDDEFIPYACEIDGVPQNDLVASQVINLLCSSR